MRLVPRLAAPVIVLALAAAGCGSAHVAVEEVPGPVAFNKEKVMEAARKFVEDSMSNERWDVELDFIYYFNSEYDRSRFLTDDAAVELLSVNEQNVVTPFQRTSSRKPRISATPRASAPPMAKRSGSPWARRSARRGRGGAIRTGGASVAIGAAT